MVAKNKQQRVSAYGLVTDADRILLCRISPVLPRWVGQWTLPGGGVDFGEHPEDALVREVEEETGLYVSAGAIETVDSIFDQSGDEPFHGIRLIYRAQQVGGHLRDEADGTTDRACWWRRNELATLALVDIAQAGVGIAFAG